MHRLLPLILFSLCTQSFALSSKVDDTSSTNLPTAYSTASTSLLITGLANMTVRKFMLTNTSSSLICCNVLTQSTTVAPSSGDGTELCIPGTAIKAWDDIPVYKNVYCRSASGSPTSSGLLLVEVW